MLLHLETHLGHRRHHFGAKVCTGIYRRDGKISAFNRGAVTEVTLFEYTACIIGTLLGIQLIEGVVHADVPTGVVKNEELRFRTEIGCIADTRRLEIGFGTFCQ